jgi:hypothetical protein
MKYIHDSMQCKNREFFSECESSVHVKYIILDNPILQALCINKAGKMHSMYKNYATRIQHCFVFNPLK